jgi:LTXXQ motif family protein
MSKKAAVAAIAFLMTTSSLAYAAETSSTVGMRGPSAADLNSLTDMRVGLVKAALQLTPDQEKLWPPLEEAIRARSKSRMARLERVAELRDNGPTDALSDRNPVDLMQRRADMLIQRGNDLKKVADAWQPLYKTLSQDQKRRMAYVSMVALRGMRDAVERRTDSEEDDD